MKARWGIWRLRGTTLMRVDRINGRGFLSRIDMSSSPFRWSVYADRHELAWGISSDLAFNKAVCECLMMHVGQAAEPPLKKVAS